MIAKSQRQARIAQRVCLGHVWFDAFEHFKLFLIVKETQNKSVDCTCSRNQPNLVVAEKVGVRIAHFGLQLGVQITDHNAQIRAEQIVKYFDAHPVALAQHREFGLIVLVVIGIGFEVDLYTYANQVLFVLLLA